jgi:DNA-binding MarR family transcriptional regulator
MRRPPETRHAAGGTGPHGPVLDLGSHIPTKIAILANRLSRAASRYYRKRYGIGVVEWRLVMYLGGVTETRANRICSETELDKGAVSRSLAVLQRMGFVSVKEDGADSRRHNVALTAKGLALHHQMVPLALDRQSDLLAALTPAEIATLVSLLDRLLGRVGNGASMFPEPPAPAYAQLPKSPRAKPISRRVPR